MVANRILGEINILLLIYFLIFSLKFCFFCLFNKNYSIKSDNFRFFLNLNKNKLFSSFLNLFAYKNFFNFNFSQNLEKIDES